MAQGKTKIVAQGQTYDNRERLKELGFVWDATQKEWLTYAEDEEIDQLIEQVQEECPGVECECKILNEEDLKNVDFPYPPEPDYKEG